MNKVQMEFIAWAAKRRGPHFGPHYTKPRNTLRKWNYWFDQIAIQFVSETNRPGKWYKYFTQDFKQYFITTKKGEKENEVKTM